MKKEKDKGYCAQSLSCWAFKSQLWFPSYPYSGTLQLISSLVAKHRANNLKKKKKKKKEEEEEEENILWEGRLCTRSSQSVILNI